MSDSSLKARTRLGERLLEIRKRVVASGERLLSPDEIENESCANCADLQQKQKDFLYWWRAMRKSSDTRTADEFFSDLKLTRAVREETFPDA